MSKVNNIRKDFFCQCGEEFFKLRRKQKLSLLELSQKTRISMAQLDLLERGKVNQIWILCKLAAFYGKSIKAELEEPCPIPPA